MLGFLKRGIQQLARGSSGNLRGDYSGALCSTDAHARFQEAVLSGRVWSAMTAATGVAPGSSLGTTGAFTLYNPMGSNVNLVVWETAMGYVSGTLGAGYIAYTFDPAQPAAAAPTGTAIVARNLLLSGSRANGCQAQALTTSTLANTAVQFKVFTNNSASLATTAVASYSVVDAVDGKIIVAPGHHLSLIGVQGAAGTSPLLVFSMVWEEVDVI